MKRLLYMGAACLGIAAMLCGCSSSGSSAGETETSAETSETEASSAKELNSQKYAYDYDLDKYVTLGQYKGLTYTITDTSVSDEDVETNIQSTLDSHAEPEQITDREVKDGDTVNIDFNGTMDGKDFDGGSSTGYSLTIGSGTFIDGFEDGLIGHKPGDKVTLNLKFPDDYSNTDYAGKDVQFDVTINYIEGDKITPELTDDFVASLGIDNVSTVDEYRKYVRDQMETENKNTAQQNEQQQLVREAVANATIKDYPEELVQQYKDNYTSYYKQYADYYGQSLDDFLSENGQYFGTEATNEQELETEAEDYGRDAAGNMMVICAIADAEGYEVTDEIYQEKLNSYVEQYGFNSAQALEAQYGNRYLKQIMINEEVLSILEKDAKGVEPETGETGETSAET